MKKNYKWGKGYERRQQESQRKDSEKKFKRREGPRLVEDSTEESLAEAYQEAEIVTIQRKADKFREAWEAEKTLNQMARQAYQAAESARAYERKHAAFRGLLLGIFTGLILGLIIGAFLL